MAGLPGPSVLMDIDGNGRPEVIAARFSLTGGGLLPIYALEFGPNAPLIDRTADFLPLSRQTDRAGEGAGDLFVEDLNGNGREDLVISRNFPGDPLLFFQNARGRFVVQELTFGTQVWVAIGDVTGDRRPVIVVTSGLTVRVHEVDQETRLNESITGRLSGDRL